MMREQIIAFKIWYEARPTREKLLVLVLTCAIIYALFNYLLFNPLDKEEVRLTQNLKTSRQQIKMWQTQIKTLQSISETPLYKKWQAQRQLFDSLQGKYKGLIQSSPATQWQDIIKATLGSQKNITLVQIKNLPESLYNPAGLPADANKIYEQRLTLIIYSNYFDTLNYIRTLEEALPNIHWTTLNYTVAQYPVAKVEMEFSIFYEKQR